ncbi:hypothetical protein SZ63_03765 [Methanoculleus sediminis]|uniref:PKD domain-containing protein n=2 Tax=Methanoculleus sediminis TaxID=1550566 RepID=A0A0H1R646_9EURY|nr:hypothetical protein SZ63_03765 [Methanoculleus sediminis]
MPPTAAFSGTPTTGSAPLEVQFTDTSAGWPSSWYWDFGDGGTSTDRNPVHVYSSAGTYTVSLTATNADGSDTETRSGYITVTPPPPEAAFSGTLTSGTAPLTVSFTDASTGGPTGWAWFFGDETYGGAWTEQTGDAAWPERFQHDSVAMPDGSIVVMGGLDDEEDPLNDTWRSTDGGTTWTRQTEHAGWTARALHTSVALPDGSILLTGGDDESTWKNDAWRSADGGATWTQVTDSADWTGRRYHTAVALPDGSIVLTGGHDGVWKNDAWRSTDGGATWTELPDTGWPARSMFASVAASDGSIVLMGGFNGTAVFNDVWRLQPAGSTAENPTHTYTAPGTYSVALQVYNAGGSDIAQSTGYITVTASPTPTPTRRPSSGGGGGGSTGGPDGYNVGGDSVVSRVNVTGTGLEMLIVTGWKQSSPGAGIPPAPGTPYQYIDLVPARFETITGANITFTVPAAWLEEHGFTPEEIVLYHYNGTAWEALPTTIESVTGTTVTFTATTPGFSLFAISGVERGEEVVTTPTAAQTTPTAATTTSRAAAEPTVTQTAAAPAGEPAPEFPLGTVALVAGVILVLAGGGYLIRRWWIRRQNPALFRKYD